MCKIKSIPLALAILGQMMAGELSWSQSTFYFLNFNGSTLDAPVFDALGNRLSETNYLAMLYGGPAPDSLSPATASYLSAAPMSPVPFFDRPGLEGYFLDTGYVVIPSVDCGAYAWLQVRAWHATLGSTYESVLALGLGGYGESNIFYARGGNPCSVPPTVPEYLVGLQSFSLRPVVPEPSTWALFALGAVCVWFMARRKR